MRCDSLPLWRTESLIYAFIFSYFRLILLHLKLLKASSHRIPKRLYRQRAFPYPFPVEQNIHRDQKDESAASGSEIKVAATCARKDNPGMKLCHQSLIARKYLVTAHSSCSLH